MCAKGGVPVLPHCWSWASSSPRCTHPQCGTVSELRAGMGAGQGAVPSTPQVWQEELNGAGAESCHWYIHTHTHAVPPGAALEHCPALCHALSVCPSCLLPSIP